MTMESKADKTLFYCNLFLFLVMAFCFSVIFWDVDYFQEVKKGNLSFILRGLLYLTICIILPLFILSWASTRFIITDGKIKVIDWFGLRRKTYSILSPKNIRLKEETAFYYFKHHDFFGKYNKYYALYMQTKEGRKLKIKSRYYKNFHDLHNAIRS